MYRRLMIVVDDDPVCRAAATEGLDLAKALGAEVLFFHVAPDYVAPVIASDVMPLGALDPQDHERHARERATRILEEAASLATAKGVAFRGLVGHGPEAGVSVAEAAQEHQCDLIVVGSHGRTALQRLIHGSMAASLLPLAPVPLLVCKVRDAA